ncbi:MAG TPA: hypothetical protein VIJ51_15885 [Solirubrobacteraceae bacterium]
MRNPIRSETDAFYILFGGALLIGVSFALATLVTAIAGIVVFAAGVAAALAWEFKTKDPERRRPLREAALAGNHASAHDRPVVLVVANRTLAEAGLRAELRERAAAGAELRILAPILVSRVRYVASDVDRELEQARARLAAALAWASAEGIPATGAVGDPLAALSAIEDELRLHTPTEVIVSSLPSGRSNWLETGILERLRDELEIPVTHVVGADAEARVAARA